MKLSVEKSKVAGKVKIPGSKSHTIRALFIAGFAEGKSQILNPLLSSDTFSAMDVCRALGAKIDCTPEKITVVGFGGRPAVPADVINVGNSGTALPFGMVAASLTEGYAVFTGDEQIRRRPVGPLIQAMNNLGAQVIATCENGCAPVVVKGKIKGGKTGLRAVTSQYLSALLIGAPLFEQDTEIELAVLNEIPYVDMTLKWLDKQNIKYMNNNYKTFTINGGQRFAPFTDTIPGDFSSATFFAVMAAVSGGEIRMENLDIQDTQGDKAVLDILKGMGAHVEIQDNAIVVKGRTLKGMEVDMNAIPDALPAMAVAGCFASGETRLVNVPQARLKETDRIHVMCEELRKMGADIYELEDGLVIRESSLTGTEVNGHGDHRIVMSLAIAGLNSNGRTMIDTAEAIRVTFPEFVDDVKLCGGNMELRGE